MDICRSSNDFYFLVIFKIGFEKIAKGQSQFTNYNKGTYLLQTFLSLGQSIALVFCHLWADLSKICCSSLMHICSGCSAQHQEVPPVPRALILHSGASWSTLELRQRPAAAELPSWLAYSFLLGCPRDWFTNSYFVSGDL